MKCPNCGRWNQASFPRCFECGTPLEKTRDQLPPTEVNWREKLQDAQPSEVYISFSEDAAPDAAIPSAEDQEVLGTQMEELKERRRRGELQLAELRKQARKVKRTLAEAPVLRPQPEADGPEAYEAFIDEAALPETPATAADQPDAWDADPRLNEREQAYLRALQGTSPAGRRAHRRQHRAAPVTSSAQNTTAKNATREFVFTDDDDAPVLYDGYLPSPGGSTYRVRGADPDPMQAELERAAWDASQHSMVSTTYARGRYQQPAAAKARQERRVRHRNTPLLLFRVTAILVAIVVVTGLSYWGFNWIMARWNNTVPGQAEDQVTPATVEASTMADGAAAHTVYISGKEGTQIYIKELQKSYVVTGGVAEIQIADYFWFEDLENIQTDDMPVTLTPTIKYATGEQKPMDPVKYTIQVPLSTIQLIRPESVYAKVSTSLFDIRFQVAKNSRVIIDGEDMTGMIDMNGRVSKGIHVDPIGENKVQISVRSKYHRQNNLELVLYREPQEITLEMAPDTVSDYTPNPPSKDKNMTAEEKAEELRKQNELTLYATTDPEATITVESPHHSLNTANLKATGTFSFIAQLTDIGDNEIIIRASLPGKKDAVVTHIINYMPPPEIYTTKAWLMDRTNYLDIVNHATHRKGTIYYCKAGTITRIVSERPQIAEMDVGTDGTEMLVLLENSSKTDWEVGKVYDIYGDSFGTMYGNIPRVTARYTYPK